MYRYWASLALVAFIALVGFQIAAVSAQPMATNPGDLIVDIITPESGIVGQLHDMAKAVGFDGSYLYYAEWAGSVLHRIDVPPPGQSLAAGQFDIPIQGSPSGIMSISYDLSRDAFWAIGGDGLSVYLMDKSGQATLRYRINPVTDRPGDCKQRGSLWTSGCSTEVKINYDAADDTIWYAPDTTERIYHYRTFPNALGTAQLVDATPFVDVDVAPNNMYLECGYSQVSGVAVGGPNLLINIAGCPSFFEFTKTGTKVGSYPIQPPPSGDTECDDQSYSVPVFWARDGGNGHIYAYQQPNSSTCRFGGGLRVP